MKTYLFLVFSLITCYSYAQEVQWATEVIEYSSQFSGKDFSAAQVTGPPNAFKFGGKDPMAWMASSPNAQEYLVVGFGSPMKIRQIAVVESSNPGAIEMIYVYDENQDAHLVGSFIPGPIQVNNRILNVFLPTYDFNITSVKIVLDGSMVPGANSIDAIGVSTSVVPIRFREGFAYRLNPRLVKKNIDLEAAGEESDIRPVYSADEKTLFFTRGFSEDNVGGINDPGDVWFATFDNGKYSDPVRLGEKVNNIGFNTSNSIYDKDDNPRLMVGNVSGNANKVKANLSAVTKESGAWTSSDVQKIKSAGEIPVDADYTITDNGNVLIISSELKGTQGGTDLYVSLSEGENKWGAPVNITSINTPEDEYAPFFSMEENALYFTSKGYPGLGGSDIFRVKRLDDSWQNWGEPENIGEDINTPYNDHYFYFDEKDAYAYLAQGTKDGMMRIVRVDRPQFMDANPLVVVKGKVMDEQAATPVNALLSLLIEPGNEIYGVTFSNEMSGNYQIFLRSGYKYKVIGEKEGYKKVEMPITLENKDKPYTFDLNIFLSRELAESQPELVADVVAIGAGIEAYETEEVDVDAEPEEELDDIDKVIVATAVADDEYEEISAEEFEEVNAEEFQSNVGDYAEPPSETRSYSSGGTGLENLVVFNFDSEVVLPPAYPILDAIAAFLLRHQDIRLEIGGFTDYIGDYYYNIELSKRRAYAVRQYMIDQGVERSRIRVLGFGEKMPIIANMDSEEIRMNRRAEFNFTKY
jgi:outer membrane protein OmpA-like peptidoglycan-associated protein